MANFLKNLFDKKGDERVDVARRFELLARVGQGSMSKVWRARDPMTGRMLAIKVLDKAKTERFESRFVGLKKPNEGEISISLKHPNIANTHEFGTTTNGELYLMMDFIEGFSLSYLVDSQNEQMKDNCLNYIIQLGEGLEYLHKQNWIHRDLCPRNVMVDSDNTVKLIDFGLVVPNTPSFQKPGNRTGTANYMAPELIKRQRTDQRIDIFSFAVTAYEMYTKRLPWDVPDQQTLDTVLQHINKPPTPIASLASQIDPRVAEVIMKGLMTNPDDRWQSMSELLTPLRRAHEEIEAKRSLERKMKAAVDKVKNKEKEKAASAALAKKAADDDAFFEQILRDEATSRSEKPKSKPTVTPPKSQSVTGTQKPSSADPKLQRASKPASSEKKNSTKKPISKPSAPKPVAVPNDVEDEFDGIEIEIEGHKLDEIDPAPNSSDDTEGLEIESKVPLDSPGTMPSDRRTLAGLIDEEPRAPRETDKSIAVEEEEEEEEEEEPVLRLPDDD